MPNSDQEQRLKVAEEIAELYNPLYVLQFKRIFFNIIINVLISGAKNNIMFLECFIVGENKKQTKSL